MPSRSQFCLRIRPPPSAPSEPFILRTDRSQASGKKQLVSLQLPTWPHERAGLESARAAWGRAIGAKESALRNMAISDRVIGLEDQDRADQHE